MSRSNTVIRKLRHWPVNVVNGTITAKHSVRKRCHKPHIFYENFSGLLFPTRVPKISDQKLTGVTIFIVKKKLKTMKRPNFSVSLISSIRSCGLLHNKLLNNTY